VERIKVTDDERWRAARGNSFISSAVATDKCFGGSKK